MNPHPEPALPPQTLEYLHNSREFLLARLHDIDSQITAAEPEALVSGPYPWIDLDDFRTEMQTVRRTRRPTGLPTLDLALNGGLPGGVVITAVGPAGSCKSAFELQLALDRARAVEGKVYIYAPDQGGTQPLERLAETFGDVADDDGAFTEFVASCGEAVRVADERDPAVTMESFTAAVLAAADAAAILIDTPQAVVAEGSDERGRIDSTMEMARKLARGCLAPVFLASHANRGATAARKREDRNRELSAGLGSVKIEHRSQVVIYMDKVEREDGVTEIDVRIPKASFGQSGRHFRLRLDPSTWRLSEIDAAASSDETLCEETRAANKALDSEVMAYIETRWIAGERPSKNSVISGFRAARENEGRTGVREKAIADSIARLIAAVKVNQEDGPRGAHLLTRPIRPGSSAAPPAPPTSAPAPPGGADSTSATSAHPRRGAEVTGGGQRGDSEAPPPPEEETEETAR